MAGGTLGRSLRQHRAVDEHLVGLRRTGFQWPAVAPTNRRPASVKAYGRDD